jgi:hypothetical protein
MVHARQMLRGGSLGIEGMRSAVKPLADLIAAGNRRSAPKVGQPSSSHCGRQAPRPRFDPSLKPSGKTNGEIRARIFVATIAEDCPHTQYPAPTPVYLEATGSHAYQNGSVRSSYLISYRLRQTPAEAPCQLFSPFLRVGTPNALESSASALALPSELLLTAKIEDTTQLVMPNSPAMAPGPRSGLEVC